MYLISITMILIICICYWFFKNIILNYFDRSNNDTLNQIILDSTMNVATKNKYTFLVSQLVLTSRVDSNQVKSMVRIPFNTSCVDEITKQYIVDIVRLIEQLFIIDHHSVVRYADSFKSIGCSLSLDGSFLQETSTQGIENTKSYNFVNTDQQKIFDRFIKKYSDQPYPWSRTGTRVRTGTNDTTYSRLFFDRIELVLYNGDLFLTCDRDKITFHSMTPGSKYVERQIKYSEINS
jgi:hypothetical protein